MLNLCWYDRNRLMIDTFDGTHHRQKREQNEEEDNIIHSTCMLSNTTLEFNPFSSNCCIFDCILRVIWFFCTVAVVTRCPSHYSLSSLDGVHREWFKVLITIDWKLRNSDNEMIDKSPRRWRVTKKKQKCSARGRKADLDRQKTGGGGKGRPKSDKPTMSHTNQQAKSKRIFREKTMRV